MVQVSEAVDYKRILGGCKVEVLCYVMADDICRASRENRFCHQGEPEVRYQTHMDVQGFNKSAPYSKPVNRSKWLAWIPSRIGLDDGQNLIELVPLSYSWLCGKKKTQANENYWANWCAPLHLLHRGLIPIFVLRHPVQMDGWVSNIHAEDHMLRKPDQTDRHYQMYQLPAMWSMKTDWLP